MHAFFSLERTALFRCLGFASRKEQRFFVGMFFCLAARVFFCMRAFSSLACFFALPYARFLALPLEFFYMRAALSSLPI
jgi:hypothetical protein